MVGWKIDVGLIINKSGMNIKVENGKDLGLYKSCKKL